jgi:glycosyltransferase involved in cell wall biosynthesis
VRSAGFADATGLDLFYAAAGRLDGYWVYDLQIASALLVKGRGMVSPTKNARDVTPGAGRLLFVSRAYPPTLGGIENQNRGVFEALRARILTTGVINRQGKRALPVFLPRALFGVIKDGGRNDAILLGDGLLAPLGAIAKALHPATRIFAVVHGLDITFASRPGLASTAYRHINIPSLARLDGVIAVGRATAAAAITAGVPPAAIHFIPNGFDPEEFRSTATRHQLSTLAGRDLSACNVLVHVGRYVARKGLEWFIREVLPTLPESVFLVAAGAAPTARAFGDPGYLAQCQNAARDSGQAHRVKLLVNISQEDLKICLGAADLVIIPNIEVAGTIEGFGLIALEAAAMGRVVLAAKLEGLLDAIVDGQNGIFVPSKDPRLWRTSINHWLENPQGRDEFGKAAAIFVREHFTWSRIAQRYLDLLFPNSA